MWRLAIYEYHEYWVFTNYNGYYIRLDFGRLLDSVLSMQCVASKFEVSEYLLSYKKRLSYCVFKYVTLSQGAS